MIGPLRGRLPGGRLADDGQRRQRGQAGQHVPADDLGPDRALHRAGGGIQVVRAVHVQRAEPAVQAGQVGGAAGEPCVVGVLQRRALIHRGGEAGRRVQVVVHGRPGGEFALGGDDAHHPQGGAQHRGRVGRPPRSWARLASRARITEPTRTPLSCASVKEASASPGWDGSGIRPESSIAIRGSCPGGTSLIRVLSVSIGFRQDAQPSVTAKAAGTGVTEVT